MRSGLSVIGSLTRKHLAILLSKVEEHPTPNVRLEQYTLSSEEVSDLLWIIETSFSDVSGKVVVDLGCGTGRLTIGSALLGASLAVGVDVDEVALRVASRCAKELKVEHRTAWIRGFVPHVNLKADVVIQNPPYGVRRAKADRPFIEAALEIAPVVYSLHKYSEKSRKFIREYVKSLGGEIDKVIPLEITIRPTYGFHIKRAYKVKVDLYRIVRARWGT
ncbi:MAG: hypothetical protein DRJ62_00605 [Thermoprotei archaeon]|nr:MAG: hypothetical protein DRJ62_00605 [Thermoprotei archaeon]